MTPRQVDEMTRPEYLAFWDYAVQQTREAQREARRRR